MEYCLHRFADGIELGLGALEILLVYALTSGIGQWSVVEHLPDRLQVSGRLAGLFVHTVVEELVGRISQQDVVADFPWFELVYEVIQRMAAVVLYTLGQTADVYQIVRLHNEQFGEQDAIGLDRYCQKVELCALVQKVGQTSEDFISSVVSFQQGVVPPFVAVAIDELLVPVVNH